MQDFISKKGGVTGTEDKKPLKQQYIDAGLSSEDADKAVRIHFGLEPKAPTTVKGKKFDPQTNEAVDMDTGKRYGKDSLNDPDTPEWVRQVFKGHGEATAEKKETALLKFNQRLEAQNHSFDLAIKRSDHAGAQRYVTAAKNDLVQAEGRSKTMDQNEQDALAGNQQAMLSLVANHIGMTLGAQKGARITRAVWDEAIQSAPWLEVKAARWFHTDENGDHIFDGYKGGVTLTRDQIEQMVALAHQKVDTLKDQVANMQTTFQKELGTGTPAGGGTANPNAPPAAPVLNDEEKKIQQLLNGGGPQ